MKITLIVVTVALCAFVGTYIGSLLYWYQRKKNEPRPTLAGAFSAAVTAAAAAIATMILVGCGGTDDFEDVHKQLQPPMCQADPRTCS